MSEFSLIDRYCRGIGAIHDDTVLGVGDDAAIVEIPTGSQLAVSTDSMVEGVHFFRDVLPENLAHKLLVVNASDLAAMGAKPKWATLCATLPQIHEQWNEPFFGALHQAAKQYDVQLIGGDTTQGPLVLSLQIMGLLPSGQGLTRAGAKSGDDIYVSGVLGDPALALHYLSQPGQGELTEQLRMSLERPVAQVALGRALLDHASSCIDVSDGLLADLEHIAKASSVSLQLDIDALPVSSDYLAYLERSDNYDFALSGGDDYQLAFTVDPAHRSTIVRMGQQLGVNVTRIGSVSEAREYTVQAQRGAEVYAPKKNNGYQHFG